MNDIDRQIIEEIRRLKTALAISDRREVSAGLFAPSARGMNLMANGSGLLGTNYNLSSLTFDAVETHGGGGSFKATTGVTVLSDEYIAVDTTRYYRGVEWVKNGDADGTRYDAAAGHYGGSAAYDIDKNLIGAQHVMKHAGSTDTTLAVALNPGDTTMTLTNATGWNNGGVGIGDGYTRQVAWWPYLNSLGYAYPAYTYSRNHSGTYAAYSMYSTVGMWAPGGVSGNTVTLAAPWPGPALPIGTPIRNATSGGTYDYFISGSVKPAQNVWTRYEGTIGPLADPIGGWTSAFTFRPGTAFIKLLFLMNYSGYTTNNQRISDIWFSDMSAQNLEEATQTRIGVVGIGTQYFSGSKRWYVPTTVSYVVGGWFPSTGSYRTCFVNLGNPTTRIGFSMWNSSGVETIRLDPASTTFINTGGYVAIGKTSASYLLDVNGAVAATDLVISKTVAGAWAALEIRNSNSATNDTADITFKMTSAAVGPSAKISAVRVGASAITDLVFYTGEASTALVEALRIKNTTRWIGVGTSDPQTLLHTVLNSAIVNAPVEVQRIEARTSGVAGAGFGPMITAYAESATDGTYRQVAAFKFPWATATDASRKGRLLGTLFDTAERQWLQVDTDGASTDVLIDSLIYGSMYMDDGAQAVTATLAGAYYAVNGGLTGSLCNGMTFQNARELLVTVAGTYRVTWSISLSNSASDNTVAAAVMVNATEKHTTENATRAKENGVVYAMAGTGIIALAVNDVVKLCVENETAAGSTMTVTHANLSLVRIGA